MSKITNQWQAKAERVIKKIKVALGFLQVAKQVVCDFYVVSSRDLFVVRVLPSNVFLVQDKD